MGIQTAGNILKPRAVPVVAAALLLLGIVGLSGVVNAQEEEEQIPAGQGLEISPPLLELDADPGETLRTEIRVRNITGLDVRTVGSVEDFVARDESGTPRILGDSDEASPYPLAEYVQRVPELELAPTEQKSAEIIIDVPENASPGGHFGVVRFSGTAADPNQEGSIVDLRASVGVLILLNVSGDTTEELTVEELFVSRDGQKGRFFETGPFTFSTRLKNSGNVYLQPAGELSVTNLFGKEVATIPFNNNDDDKRNVLPDSIRRFDEELNEKDVWFGRYTLAADLQYGPEGTRAQDSVDFWVIPYKIVGVVLLMLVAVGIFGRKALRSYKQHVVRKYQQSQDQSEAPDA